MAFCSIRRSRQSVSALADVVRIASLAFLRRHPPPAGASRFELHPEPFVECFFCRERGSLCGPWGRFRGSAAAENKLGCHALYSRPETITPGPLLIELVALHRSDGLSNVSQGFSR